MVQSWIHLFPVSRRGVRLKLIFGRNSAYLPIEAVNKWSRNDVGPKLKKKHNNNMARMMFIWLIHFMPFPIPERTEIMNNIVIPKIMTICVLNPLGILLFK